MDIPEEVFDKFRRTYERLSERFGKKPFIQAELNADGDVTSSLYQALYVMKYYGMVRDTEAPWLTGISMYQFRDRGRLGLETEDPNNPSVGIKQPLMAEYKRVLADRYFMPVLESAEEISFPAPLRWGGSEDADGIETVLVFDNTPVFCEVTFRDELSLMIEFNGRWFYRSPDVPVIDLMPAFFDRPLSGRCAIPIRFFATPPDGENHDTGDDDWDSNYRTVMENEPEFRIRYETPYASRIKNT